MKPAKKKPVKKSTKSRSTVKLPKKRKAKTKKLTPVEKRSATIAASKRLTERDEIKKIKTENLLLRDQLEHQTRELQIEAALERVRAVAMSMHKSEELIEVSKTLKTELDALGFQNIRNTQIAIANDAQGSCMSYDYYNEKRQYVGEIRYDSHSFIKTLAIKFRKNKASFVNVSLTGKKLNNWRKHLKSLINAPAPKLDAAKGLHYYYYSFGTGGLGFCAYSPLDKPSMELLRRFKNVFELAYRRYADIEKAEAQAREAQIESALEKVRSRAMAMHQSHELAAVLEKIYQELQLLGFNALAADLMILTEDKTTYDMWVSGKPGTEGPYRMNAKKLLVHPIHISTMRAWKSGEEIHEVESSGKTLKSMYEAVFSDTDFITKFPNLFPDEVRKSVLSLERMIHTTALTKLAGIRVASDEKRTGKQVDIQKRFARVFEQTYTRFLDLQKAEAQAREAQIEAALERIRSRSLAMHKSEEIKSIVKVVFEQLKNLNFAIDGGAFIGIPDTANNNFNIWVGDDHSEYPTCFRLPYHRAAPIADVWQAYDAGADFLSIIYPKKVKNNWFRYAFEHTDFKTLPTELKEWILNQEFLTQTFALAKYSGVGIHFHHHRELSPTEIDILKRFSHVFEQGYIRFLDLQKAEAQAREAKIENALEKVRSRSLAMHKSDELQEVVNAVFDRLQELEIETDASSISVFNSEDSNMYMLWIQNAERAYSTCMNIPYYELNKFGQDIIDGLKNKKELVSNTYSKEEKNEWFNYMFSHSDFKYIPDSRKEFILSAESASLSHASTKNASITLSRYSDKQFSEKENEILKRFARVFEQSYTRFLDLEKAEAQAREAQIENALEKVRSRSLAMHKSDELQEVINTVFDRLKELEIETDTASIIIYKEGSLEFEQWIQNDERNYSSRVMIPFFEQSKLGKDLLDVISTGRDLFSRQYSREEKNEWFSHMFEHSDLKHIPNDRKKYVLESLYYNLSIATIKNGSVGLARYSGKTFSDEENNVLKRFARVFEQAYTRFLDLQKAEAQAREAQIEAALERVRSSSLAMHKSEELQDVVTTVFERLNDLNITTHAAGIIIFNDISREMQYWFANDELKYTTSFQLPYFDFPLFQDVWASRNTKNDILHKSYPYEEKNKIFKAIFENTDFRKLTEERKSFILQGNAYTIAIAFTKNAAIQWNRYSDELYSESDLEILKRFARVFEQAYVRFLDLQKAEAQAREAEIELALERVRARTMAMQRSDELQDAALILFQQIKLLGAPAWTCGYNIWDEDGNGATAWMGSELGLMEPMKTPIDTQVFQRIYEASERSETLYVEELKGSALEAHYKFMHTIPSAGERLKKVVASGQALPTIQLLHNAFFQQGYLMFITFEPVPLLWEVLNALPKSSNNPIPVSSICKKQKRRQEKQRLKLRLSVSDPKRWPCTTAAM